ncbi:hypothetical protein AcW1_002563 [Taiwanofungus camphoratus]|nr:hypothetical protein AcW1_002563 [Antrodia cinnamomea]
MKVIPRLNQERTNADHRWLETFHTFAITDDPQHKQFGCLRILNEDRVEPNNGFDMHAHRDFEIFTYVVSGQLEHRDSMGNIEILKRGDLQMTSAGTGIRHSEKCYGSEQLHLLQIWSTPSTPSLPPTYYTRHFADEKKDKWVLVVAPAGEGSTSEMRDSFGPAPVHSPLTLHATLLSPTIVLSHTFPVIRTADAARKAYIHVVQTSGYNPQASSGAKVKISGGDTTLELGEGDGAYIMGEANDGIKVENVSDRPAEVLLFDLE